MVRDPITEVPLSKVPAAYARPVAAPSMHVSKRVCKNYISACGSINYVFFFGGLWFFVVFLFAAPGHYRTTEWPLNAAECTVFYCKRCFPYQHIARGDAIQSSSAHRLLRRRRRRLGQTRLCCAASVSHFCPRMFSIAPSTASERTFNYSL